MNLDRNHNVTSWKISLKAVNNGHLCKKAITISEQDIILHKIIQESMDVITLKTSFLFTLSIFLVQHTHRLFLRWFSYSQFINKSCSDCLLAAVTSAVTIVFVVSPCASADFCFCSPYLVVPMPLLLLIVDCSQLIQ